MRRLLRGWPEPAIAPIWLVVILCGAVGGVLAALQIWGWS